MSEIKTMVYHIICAYWYSGQNVYNKSILTIFRGATKGAPVAILFKNYYFFGIRAEIDYEIIEKTTNSLVEKGIINQEYNEEEKRYHFKPADMIMAGRVVQYIRKNKDYLLKKYY